MQKITKFLKNNFAHILFITFAVVGLYLLSRAYLPEGFALLGHDSGLPLDSKQFLLSRLFAWDDLSFGKDNSAHFGSLVLHGFDYLSSYIAQVPYAGNEVNLFFWLSSIFISGFIFAYSLKDKLGKYSPFLFPVFITINFYILQSIFILERAKYSVLVATLLFLTLTFKVVAGRISVLAGALIGALILSVFNSGSWWGLPLYGGFMVIVFSLIFVKVIETLKHKSGLELRRLIGFLAVTLVVFILLNAYSVLPYFSNFLTYDAKSLVSSDVITANKAWLESMSKATSFANFFRLQGAPDWYLDSEFVNTSHAYSGIYHTNKGLIFLSFVFPILAFSSILLVRTHKQKSTSVFFVLVALVSMFFMAGTHSPLGGIYGTLYDNLPGFSIFRSPYYKFGSAYFISISVLLSITISILVEKLGGKLMNFVGDTSKFISSSIKYVLITATILSALSMWLGYHYVFTDSEKILDWQDGLTTRVKIPDYIYGYSKDKTSYITDDQRVLIVPHLNKSWNNDAYEWGYWSLSLLPSLLNPSAYLTNEHSLNNEEKSWVEKLYESIIQKDEMRIKNYLSHLNIGYVLLRKDVLLTSSWSGTESPYVYQKNIESFDFIEKQGEFGEWILYKINVQQKTGVIRAIGSLSTVPETRTYLSREFLKQESTLLQGDGKRIKEVDSLLFQRVNAYQCESCALEEKVRFSSLPDAKILPNSPLYQFKIKQESDLLQETGNTNPENMVNNYLGLILRRSGEVKIMIDSGVDERYVIESLKVVNLYLNNVYNLTISFSDPEADYARASIILGILDPIQNNLRNYVLKSEFVNFSNALRSEILNVLWNIYTFESYYSPILSNTNTLKSEKTYTIELPVNEHDFYASLSSFPQDKEGSILYPTRIFYRKDNKKVDLELGEENSGWVKILFPEKESGKIILTLAFDQLQNLFQVKEQEFRQSPGGTRNCILGEIGAFNKNKTYEVRVKTEAKVQALRLFFQETTNTKRKDGFVQGESEADISEIASSEPDRHLYSPTVLAESPSVLLCSSNRLAPEVEEFSIYEIYSPLIISVEKEEIPKVILPHISYQKINPSKYYVQIRDIKSPFVLELNQRFSSHWKIYSANSKDKEVVNDRNFLDNVLDSLKSKSTVADFNHFTLNGYSNGWLINNLEDKDYVIEYAPQSLFYQGIIISFVSLLITIFVLIFKKINFWKK